MSTPHLFQHEAMATTFELRIAGHPASYAGQAAAACFALADRLEDVLSRYRETSDIACINRLAPGEVFRITADTAACLALALELSALTGGAFDPTLGHATDRLRAPPFALRPSPFAPPRGRLLLDPEGLAVQVLDGPVSLDLGAIGKGFALDCMADLLGEWGVTRALLIAGGSSLLALDGPDADTPWEVGVGEPSRPFPLRHRAVGASGTTVKGAHILDPLTRSPARGVARAWAFDDSAAIADALSTAWMVLSPAETAEVCRKRPQTAAVLQPVLGAPGLLFVGHNNPSTAASLSLSLNP